MPGIAVKPEVEKELQRQMNYEFAAAHAYTAIAAWCEDQTLKGFAAFFSKQSAEEREHAAKFMKHLLDRGVRPKLDAVPAPKGDFRDLMELADHVRNLERANTVGVNQAYEAALSASDYPAQVMLHWFINEQVEEEAWTEELVERVVRANCAGGLAELDRHIERYLGGGD